MEDPVLRAKSAPLSKMEFRLLVHRASSASNSNLIDAHPMKSLNGNATLAETVNKFRTTARVVQRLKERRRTEAEVVIAEKQPEIAVPRKLSHIELENAVARFGRPTASFSARIASNRRINARDIYVPPPTAVSIEYRRLDPDRFKGSRMLTGRDIDSLVNRLSSYNPRRQPAESRGRQLQDFRKQLGPLGSYRWSGIRNC